MPNTNVVFNADTGRWRASLDAAEKSVLRTGDAVERVKGRILASYQAQVAAAREAGAGQEQLDRIQQRAAENLSKVTEANAKRTEQALDRLLDKQRKVADELNRMGRSKATEGHGISDRQAVSGAIRFGEGTSNLRAVENFIAMSPIAAKAVQALFPLIGGAGLAGIFFEMGEKGYEAFQKVMKGAEESRKAFADLHDKSQILVDDKELENQKLQDQIDKISGHPNNGLATALLEAKKMADQLLVSLQEDRRQLEAIFKEHDSGKLGTALSAIGIGPQSTSPQEDQIKADFDRLEAKIRSARSGYNKALSGATDDAGRQAATKAYNKSVHDAFQERIDAYLKEKKRLDDAQTNSFKDREYDIAAGGTGAGVDHSKQIANLDGVVDILQRRQSVEGLDESIYGRTAKLGSLKQGKDQAEEARKAMEAQRRKWEGEDDVLTNAGAGDPHILAIVWQERLRGLKQGSDQYLFAYHQFTEQNKKAAEEDARETKQGLEKADKAQREAWSMMHDNFMLTAKRSAQDEADFWSIRVLEAEQGSANYTEALAKFTQAQNKADKDASDARLRQDQARYTAAQRRGAYDLAGVELDRRNGSISSHDAAVQQANIHSQVYAAEQIALQKKLADAQANGTPAEVDAATEAIAKSKADRAVQVMQDAANTVATTWQGALRNSLSNWVQDAQDSARQVEEIARQTLDGLNQNLVNGMFGDKTDWSGMFKGIGKTIASDGLQRVEATGLKALGLGKADGSKENPWHVIVDGNGGAGGSSSGLAGLFGGAGKSGDDGGDDSDSGSGIGGILGSIAGSIFGGGFAVGGDVQAGVPIDVGEAGRERFVPSVPGKIIPHSASDGAAVYNVNVANGVTPEQMKMHVREALKEFHPQVVGASVAAVREYSARNPSSKR